MATRGTAAPVVHRDQRFVGGAHKRGGRLRSSPRRRALRRLRHPPGVVDRRLSTRCQGGALGAGRGAQGRGGGAVEGEGGGTVLGHDHPGQGRSCWSATEVVSTVLSAKWKRLGVVTRHCRPWCVMIPLWTNIRWNGSATTSRAQKHARTPTFGNEAALKTKCGAMAVRQPRRPHAEPNPCRQAETRQAARVELPQSITALVRQAKCGFVPRHQPNRARASYRAPCRGRIRLPCRTRVPLHALRRV